MKRAKSSGALYNSATSMQYTTQSNPPPRAQGIRRLGSASALTTRKRLSVRMERAKMFSILREYVFEYDKVLCHTPTLQAFDEFLERGACSELRLFLATIDAYRQLSLSEDRALRAQDIVRRFVLPGAELEINIAQQHRDDLMREWESVKDNSCTCSEKMFDPLYALVKIQLKHDWFPRFTMSKQFAGLVSEMVHREGLDQAMRMIGAEKRQSSVARCQNENDDTLGNIESVDEFSSDSVSTNSADCDNFTHFVDSYVKPLHRIERPHVTPFDFVRGQHLIEGSGHQFDSRLWQPLLVEGSGSFSSDVSRKSFHIGSSRKIKAWRSTHRYKCNADTLFRIYFNCSKRKMTDDSIVELRYIRYISTIELVRNRLMALQKNENGQLLESDLDKVVEYAGAISYECTRMHWPLKHRHSFVHNSARKILRPDGSERLCVMRMTCQEPSDSSETLQSIGSDRVQCCFYSMDVFEPCQRDESMARKITFCASNAGSLIPSKMFVTGTTRHTKEQYENTKLLLQKPTAEDEWTRAMIQCMEENEKIDRIVQAAKRKHGF